VRRRNSKGSAGFSVEPLEARCLLASTGLGPFIATPLPTELSADSIPVVVGEKVIIPHFYDKPTDSYVAKIYDIPSGQMSTVQIGHDLGAAETTVGDTAIFAGGPPGYFGPGISDAVDLYNADTDVWSTARLSVARGGISAVTVGHKAIFAGGGSNFVFATEPTSDAVDIYDADTGHWSTAHLSESRTSMGTAVIGDRMIFAGGVTKALYSTKASSAVDIYDTATGQWTTSTLPHPQYATGGVAAGRFAIFGASNAYGPESLVDLYDTTAGQWSTHAFSQQHGGIRSTGAGMVALFTGDTNNASDGASNKVDVFDAGTGTWSTETAPHALGAVTPSTAIGTKLVFAVGRKFILNDSVGSIDVYDTATHLWSSSDFGAAGQEITSVAQCASGKIVLGQYVNAPLLLTPTILPAPTPISPGNGVSFFTSPKMLTWSATPGADGYNVYLYNQPDRHVTATQVSLPTLTELNDPWHVDATIGNSVLVGPSSQFSILPSHLTAKFNRIEFHATVTASARGWITLQINNSGGDLNGPFDVTVCAILDAPGGYRDHGSAQLGNGEIATTLHHGESTTIRVRLHFPDGMDPSRYRLIATVGSQSAPLAISRQTLTPRIARLGRESHGWPVGKPSWKIE
jgi:hypothetical protein